jgi:signal transduction histidine kinase
VTPAPRRTLRTRLALLYAALFLGSGLILLLVADLPLLSFSDTSRVGARLDPPAAGGHLAPPQSSSNLHEVLIYSGIALLVLVPVSIAMAWLVADRALRPLQAITSAARAISARNLNERLSVGDSYAEFAELARTLDELLRRLDAAFESQRHFVANASHELRTPLAAGRTLLQVALASPRANAAELRSTCQQLLAVSQQQERLIEALLTLASGQRGLDQEEPVDLAEQTRAVLHSRQEQAAARRIAVESALRPAMAAGDARLTESLVANLVDNAVRHNVSGGMIVIATTTTAGGACLAISNTGPVISPAEVARLFEPFQRLGGERVGHTGGYGLGLAIVQAIAGAHDAAITAAARPGGGLDIEVRFRRAEARSLRSSARSQPPGPYTAEHGSQGRDADAPHGVGGVPGGGRDRPVGLRPASQR